MSQLELNFPKETTINIVKRKKLTRREENSIMNYTISRLLGKKYKRSNNDAT